MNPENKKKLAVFDMDGTLYKGFSQKLFINYMADRKLIDRMFQLKLYCWFILYKLGLIDDAKKAIELSVQRLSVFSEEEIASLVKDFVTKKIIPLMYRDAINKISDLKNNGYKVIILSSAITPIVSEIANFVGVDDFVSTDLEIVDGKYTGRLSSSVNYGQEKKNQLLNYIEKNNISIDDCLLFADHESDLEFLMTSKSSYFVNPNRGITNLATKNNIGIINFA